MIKKFRIYFRGLEPHINWKTEDKKGNTRETTIGFFYPFRRLTLKLYNRNLKKQFTLMGYPLKKCEGCGDGWAEWAIKEPNTKKYDIFVCQHCVGFYDWDAMTRRRLETAWEFETHMRMFNNRKDVKFKWS